MIDNDDLNLDALDAELEAAPAAKKSGKAARAVEAPEPEKKYTIVIDEVEGQGNFETIGVNGEYTQIMRGKPVQVSAAVLGVLKTAVGTRYVKVTRADGTEDLEPRQFSTIPWRLVA
jgi:hypothetical protein